MSKVSVVIPVYNVEKYLRECLDSVVNQTLKDIEIICVNDGSTDSSLDILTEYASKDNRIKIIDKKNTGYGHSMNVGIDNATGEYLGIVEPDDYIELDMYETLYNKAKELDLDFIKSDFCEFQCPQNTKIFNYRELDKSKQFYNKILTPREHIGTFNVVMYTWSGIYKLEYLRKNIIRHNETQGASYQDNGFWFQTMMFAKRGYFLDKSFYRKRKDNPFSSEKNKGKVYCICKEYDFIKQIIIKNNELKPFMPSYSLARWGAYWFALNRIDKKFKKEFIKKFSKDFKLAMKNGEINKDLFSQKDYQNLELLIYNPSKFYRAYMKLPSKLQTIFSIKNQDIHKVITICGVKLKVKSKKLKDKFDKIEYENRQKRYVDNKFNYLKKDFEYKLCKYMPEEKYAEYLKDWFYRCTGNELNLDNPQTFNEKIQWMKLYDSTPLKTQLADKYLVRDWVKEKIGEEYLIPLLGVWDKFDDIDFDKLPDKFVLKANHGCGWNIVVTDKGKFSMQDAKNKFSTWLHTNWAFMNGIELHYKNIKPLIIAEKYIESDDGDLKDYKFLCFNGEVKYIWVDKDRYSGHKRNLYDIDWNLLPVKIKYPNAVEEIEKPYNFDKMLNFARLLSKGFHTVRVDFYENKKNLYFGEMTFTSESGAAKFIPESFDLELGQLIDEEMRVTINE